MLPVPENFKRRLLAELSRRIPVQASMPPATQNSRGYGPSLRHRTRCWRVARGWQPVRRQS